MLTLEQLVRNAWLAGITLPEIPAHSLEEAFRISREYMDLERARENSSFEIVRRH